MAAGPARKPGMFGAPSVESQDLDLFLSSPPTLPHGLAAQAKCAPFIVQLFLKPSGVIPQTVPLISCLFSCGYKKLPWEVCKEEKSDGNL